MGVDSRCGYPPCSTLWTLSSCLPHPLLAMRSMFMREHATNQTKLESLGTDISKFFGDTFSVSCPVFPLPSHFLSPTSWERREFVLACFHVRDPLISVRRRSERYLQRIGRARVIQERVKAVRLCALLVGHAAMVSTKTICRPVEGYIPHVPCHVYGGTP